MKRISFGFALAATLIITSIVSFVNIQDSIILYIREQKQKLVSKSFINDVNNSQYLPLFKKSKEAQSRETSDYKPDDPLHKILREIALCR